MKELSYEEMEYLIEHENRTYFIAFYPETSSEDFIRKQLTKLMIRIQSNLRKLNVTDISVILPDYDLHFYSTFFNATGVTTYLLTRFPPESSLTDFYFISENLESDIKLFEKCSVVVNVFDPDNEDGVDSVVDNLENPNIVTIEAKSFDDELFSAEGEQPNHLLNALFKQNIKRQNKNPYDFFKGYDDRYKRVKENMLDTMLESMPGEPDVRKTITSSVERTVPDSVKKAAQQGLNYRKKYNRGGTDVGIARARDLSNGRTISDDVIQRMVSFFQRHEKNIVPPSKKKHNDGGPTNGWIAALLWGGDEGYSWALSELKKIGR